MVKKKYNGQKSSTYAIKKNEHLYTINKTHYGKKNVIFR